jgi:hypothetical protein
MSNLHDPKNVTGMAGILADADEDFDIDAMERSITEGLSFNARPNKAEDVAKEFSDELQSLSRKFGVSNELGSAPDLDEEESNLLNWSPSDIKFSSSMPKASQSSHSPILQANDHGFTLKDDDDDGDDDDDDNDNNNSNHNSSTYEPRRSNDDHPSWQRSSSSHNQVDSQMARMTDEERRQSYINDVIGKLPAVNDDDEKLIRIEEEEDDMARLLEQIDLLMTNLKAEGVDLDRIPEITNDSSKKEARSVLKILQIKNDRLRYCDMFEEAILAGAYGLESMFDGKKEWFGTKIDLIGWPETVKVKLRRMRYDTSSFVSDVMKGYNIGHGWRIIFELLPSLFLYSRDRRLRTNDNLISDESYKDAIRELQ